MRKVNKKVAAGLAAGAIAVAGGGVAFAYWTSTGSGSGTGTSASGTTDVAVTGGDASADAMGPGVAPEAITATITNPSSDHTTAWVHQLTVSIDNTNTTYQTGCAQGDYGLASTNPGAAFTDNSTSDTAGNGTQSVTIDVNQEIAAGSHVTKTFYLGFVDLTNPLNTNVDQSGCKGQSVVLAYSTN